MWFLDPLWRGPILACGALGWSCGVIGASLLVRRQSLLGETLSHAAYPGLMLMAILAGLTQITENYYLEALAVLGAYFTGWLGVVDSEQMYKEGEHQDASATWILASYMGVGVLLASWLQFHYPLSYLKIQTFLFGQAATLQDIHIVVYGVIALLTSLCFFVLQRPLLLLHFDQAFFHSAVRSTRPFYGLLFSLWTLVIVLGLRAGGVVLMPALLVCPAVCSRQLTHRYDYFVILSAVTGSILCILGSFLSVRAEMFLTTWVDKQYAWAIPSGPAIVVISVIWTFFLLLFAPQRGVISRKIRVWLHRRRCLEENILKTLCLAQLIHKKPNACVSLAWISERLPAYSPSSIRYALKKLTMKKSVITNSSNFFSLSEEGKMRAKRIVQLHRLWVVYLTHYLQLKDARVHISAEEIEHIIDEDQERELKILLGDELG